MLNVAGQQVQDIIEYNRHCELYECLKPKTVRDMDDIESGANPRWDAGMYHIRPTTHISNGFNPNH